jgi:acetyl esterase/lipase
MPLDPQVQTLLDQAAAAGRPPLRSQTVEESRALMRSMIPVRGPGPEVRSVANRTIAGTGGDIPVRVYRPEGRGPFPLLVWFHGGGWVLGDLDTADSTCRSLTVKAGGVVVSVDYRLAPEHPFPAGVDDAYAAASWVASHASEVDGDPGRIAVGGDSAGGNLATVTASQAKRRGGPQFCFQLLVYPVTDGTMDQPSYRDNGEGYQLTADAMEWFYDLYLGSRDHKDPLASPLYAKVGDLAGLPPALVITAEFDPLRDEGEAYSRRLEEAGVPVKLSRYDGQIHGFFALDTLIDAGRAALDEAAAALREAFAYPTTHMTASDTFEAR